MNNEPLKGGMSNKQRKITVAVAVGAGVILLGLIIYFAWELAGGDIRSFALTVSIVVFAVAAGFVVGVLASPLDSKERKDFSEYAKAAAAFASGYIIAAVHDTLARILSPELALSQVGGFRIVSFGTGFMVALMWIFGWRRYLTEPEKSEDSARGQK
jgi:hypothetical protein